MVIDCRKEGISVGTRIGSLVGTSQSGSIVAEERSLVPILELKEFPWSTLKNSNLNWKCCNRKQDWNRWKRNLNRWRNRRIPPPIPLWLWEEKGIPLKGDTEEDDDLSNNNNSNCTFEGKRELLKISWNDEGIKRKELGLYLGFSLGIELQSTEGIGIVSWW